MSTIDPSAAEVADKEIHGHVALVGIKGEHVHAYAQSVTEGLTKELEEAERKLRLVGFYGDDRGFIEARAIIADLNETRRERDALRQRVAELVKSAKPAQGVQPGSHAHMRFIVTGAQLDALQEP